MDSAAFGEQDPRLLRGEGLETRSGCVGLVKEHSIPSAVNAARIVFNKTCFLGSPYPKR